jgi:hypothetical protein
MQPAATLALMRLIELDPVAREWFHELSTSDPTLTEFGQGAEPGELVAPARP